ncbi:MULTISPECIES: hypothetical protein [Psychrobacter]|uniref:hypothetical protein n=1 Tax=Psychrobacter TaxID=497 RepID=UPI001866062D|nr:MULTISPECIES: hypothetical protein [Psychrobacter]
MSNTINSEAMAIGIAEGIIEPMLDNVISLDTANTLLVSALVKHLVEEGVIDLNKYLDKNKYYEERIKESYMQEGSEDESAQRDVKMIEKIFSAHRNDFAKPE